MKKLTSLSADYWIDNTNKIYEENLHISTPVIEAYEAGFKKALELAADYVSINISCNDNDGQISAIQKLGEDEEL